MPLAEFREKFGAIEPRFMVGAVGDGKRLAPFTELLKTGFVIRFAKNSGKIPHRKYDGRVELAVLLTEDFERFTVVGFSVGEFPLLVQRQRQRLNPPSGFWVGCSVQAAM